MKKMIALFLSAVLGLSLLTGCGSRYVTLGEYKGVEVNVTKNTYTEEEATQLALLAYRSETTKENGGVTNRKVEKGDTVIIDFEGTLDGVAFEGGTAAGYELGIGSGNFIAGFEDGLIGVVPGETVALDLKFPDDYHAEDLAGEDVVFTVTVQYILPNKEEMKDEVVAAFANENYSTVEEMIQYSVDYLEEYYEEEYQVNVDNAVMDAVMSQSLVEKLPEKDVKEYVEKLHNTYSAYASSYGVDVDTFISYMTGSDATSLARDYVMQSLIMQAIAKKEGIKLSEQEVTEQATIEAEAMGYTVEAYLQLVGEEEFKETLLIEKVLDFLVENAIILSE